MNLSNTQNQLLVAQNWLEIKNKIAIPQEFHDEIKKNYDFGFFN